MKNSGEPQCKGTRYSFEDYKVFSSTLYLESCLVYLLCQLIHCNVTWSTDKHLTARQPKIKIINLYSKPKLLQLRLQCKRYICLDAI